MLEYFRKAPPLLETLDSFMELNTPDQVSHYFLYIGCIFWSGFQQLSHALKLLLAAYKFLRFNSFEFGKLWNWSPLYRLLQMHGAAAAADADALEDSATSISYIERRKQLLWYCAQCISKVHGMSEATRTHMHCLAHTPAGIARQLRLEERYSLFLLYHHFFYLIFLIFLHILILHF